MPDNNNPNSDSLLVSNEQTNKWFEDIYKDLGSQPMPDDEKDAFAMAYVLARSEGKNHQDAKDEGKKAQEKRQEERKKEEKEKEEKHIQENHAANEEALGVSLSPSVIESIAPASSENEAGDTDVSELRESQLEKLTIYQTVIFSIISKEDLGFSLQLEALAEKAREEAGDESAILFETHAMFVEDDDFVECIDEMFEEENCNAEYAVQQAGEQFAAMFAAMDDAYMQARAADIRDVAQRILNNLMGVVDGGIDSDVPVILAADDLAPSETLQLDKSKIAGFVLREGSSNGHTAILARTMGIPAICGAGAELVEAYQGREAYVDGETGQVILDPDELTQQALKDKFEKQQEMKKLMETMRGQEDVTLDGRKIKLYCNIGSPDDVAAVLSNDGQGIGLFRSEFLYLKSDDYPTEDEQFEAYKAVAAAMDGKRVIIRTLDIGADKQVPYFNMQKEENPALGVRAIRICLNRPEVFRTQLRALYRASAYGKVAIMFPMITSVWEVRECKRACAAVMKELKEEGIPFDPDTEIGIMIETPASVFMASNLAKEVDFFSVGTNDLTQYTLACDRQANDLGKFFDPHHPAVLRALKMTADAAHENGIWVGICGELGADTSLLPTFLAIGIDELSVSPSSVLPLRAEIRKSIAQLCTLEKLEW